MENEEEYVQLSSWEEFVAWLEKAGMKIMGDDWNPKPKRKNKKAPPQSEGLF